MRLLRAFLADRSGNAAVEMALSLPMMLALLFVLFEGGHYLYVEQQVAKGVRDGARFAARQPFSQFTCSTINATLATQVREVTRTGVLAGGLPRVAGWTNAQITVSVSCPAAAVTTGIYAGMTNAPRVAVSTSVPYRSLFSTLGGFSTAGVVGARNEAAVMGL